MSKTFFSSDLHLGHENIINYCNRPFADQRSMNTHILSNFNSVVGEQDQLWLLGDIAFTKDTCEDFLCKLKCNNINIIWGNHDHQQIRSVIKKHPKVKFHAYAHVLGINGYKLMLCHYPMLAWTGDYHLFGHWHCRGVHPALNAFDVGVDGNGFMPWEWDELYARLVKIQTTGRR